MAPQTSNPHLNPAFPLHPCVAAVALAVAAGAFSSSARADSYAPWLTQIGINSTVASAANWGKGQLLGVVDTGVNAANPQFAAGQVSLASSSCAAVTFKCANGFADDNGHGTAVASIAAGSRVSPVTTSYGGYKTAAGNFIGVAPAANIVAEKVLNAAGSGYSTDVASGVRKAADAGVGVINVSITYGNGAATVAAINYAASKGAFIVWAGGNSAQALLADRSTSGLTAQAIQRLVFAGSVSPTNARSSFSNTPGAGALIDTKGLKTSYAQRWLMAPGEAILAPYTPGGPNALAFWSGTSMAAPIVSGSLLLLQNAWPILKTNGTTANLLLATASDLGVKGIDSTFGNGLVNLQTAFNPYGPLVVTKANGQSVSVASLNGSLITSGALGNLSAIQSKLASYTAFDGYARNFSVNLSGLIKSPATAATRNPLPTNSYSGPKVIKLAGGELAVSLQTTPAMQHLGEFGYNAELDRSPTVGYTLFTDRSETVIGFGYGTSNSYAFAKALYNDDPLARQFDDFDAASVASLAQGGHQFSYGSRIDGGLRVAGTYAATAAAPAGLAGAVPASSQVKVGASYRINDRASGGVTLGVVDESSSLLGAAYASDSILSLGRNATRVVGLSFGYRLDRDARLLVNAEFGSTKGLANAGDSLFSGTSGLRSRAYGATYLQANLWRANDLLAVSVRQPLRIVSGSAAVVMPSVDADGIAYYGSESMSLVPNGREVDYKLTYVLPTSRTRSLTLQAAYQKDAFNVAGSNNAMVGVTWNGGF